MTDVELDLHINPEAFTAKMRRTGARALKDAAEHVLGVANERVPLREGHLERSGATVVDDSALKAYISYDQPYAVRQHEELDYRHAPGRSAKYLETAVIEEAAAVEAIIAQHLREMLR